MYHLETFLESDNLRLAYFVNKIFHKNVLDEDSYTAFALVCSKCDEPCVRYYQYYQILVWEPSAAEVTKSYFLRLPALERFYPETKFSLFKSTHYIKNLKTWLRTFLWASRVPQSKFEANRSRGSWVIIGRTNRQTEIKILYIQIYTYYNWYGLPATG